MRHLQGRTIKVSKSRLLTRLGENCVQHVQEYNEALEKYHQQCVALLKERLDLVRQVEVRDGAIKEPEALAGKGWLAFSLRRPVTYESVYTQLIQMLEMDTQEEWEISGEEFRAWVNDRWDWSDDFERHTKSYLGRQ